MWYHTSQFIWHIWKIESHNCCDEVTVEIKTMNTLNNWQRQLLCLKERSKDHVVTFDTATYTLEASELASRKSRFIIEISFRNDTRRITVEQFTIAVQYNLHMSHVDRVNQLRADLIISRSQQLKWIKRMIEYIIDSVSINVYLVWNHYQLNNDLSHRNRVFIQKFIKRLLRSSDIIHQSSIDIELVYCVKSDCLINKHTRPRKQ